MRWTADAFIGGHMALDFINTVGDKDRSRQENRIADWSDFANWCAASRLFSRDQLDRLAEIAKSSDRETVLEDIIRFRETAYHALLSIIDGREPAAGEFDELQDYIIRAMNRATLSVNEGCFTWKAHTGHGDWVCDKFALLSEDLLRSPELHRLRQCGRCSWLFLDRGRGRGRRWCDMSKCGNREKSLRFRSK